MTRRARNWVALRVQIAAEAAEAVGEVMRSNAPSGLIEEPGARKDTVALTGFFATKREADEAAGAVQERLRLWGRSAASDFSATQRKVRAADWQREWRKSWSAFEAAPGLIIKPTWSRRKTRPGEVVVELYPGAAFGTGEHATTLQCLRAVKRYLRPGWQVLDVGTGSAILAIAAAKLGASRVVAVDNDIRALRCAHDNARRNGVQSKIILIASHLLSATRFCADLLTANLTAELLQELAGSAHRALRRGGIFVAAGITTEKATALERSFSPRGLAIIERADERGWTTFACRLGNRA